jgi:RHS repeat-associated protein
VIDSTGEVKGNYWYHAYGAEQGSVPDSAEQYRYTSKPLETEGNLDIYYYGARYYDPELGRFLAIDPAAHMYPDWSPYAYVLNNPLRNVDPDGSIVRDASGEVIFTPIGEPTGIRHVSEPFVDPRMVQPGYIEADDGTKIVAFQNLSLDLGYDRDCHGVTFADGDYWINNNQVGSILTGDEYRIVGKRQVGDVIVYFDEQGQPVHSATVVNVEGEAGAVTVEGLGGLEPETHQDSVSDAWQDTDVSFYFFRKTLDCENKENGSD